MENKLCRPRRCRFCKSEDAPILSPTKRRRVVLLTCARCGNELGVRYVPKGEKSRENAERA